MGANTESLIQPLADYVVVQGEEAASKTASGLYLPEAAKEKPKTAKVVAVGPLAKQVKPGDRVIHKDSYGVTTALKVNGVEFLLVKEEDILAKVK